MSLIKAYDTDGFWELPFDSEEEFIMCFMQAIFLSNGEYTFELILKGRKIEVVTFDDLLGLLRVFSSWREKVIDELE